jgi:trehalose 6-phosphate phosphatase
MQVLRPGFEIGRFMQEVSSAPQRALLLDYDGTLAPFRVERDQAVPYPGVLGLVSAIIAAPRMRVVVISGRWTQDLLPLLPIEPRPEIWGSHGWERLHPDGTHERAALDARGPEPGQCIRLGRGRWAARALRAEARQPRYALAGLAAATH